MWKNVWDSIQFSYEKVALLFETPNIIGTLWNQFDTKSKCLTFLTVKHSDIGTKTPLFHMKNIWNHSEQILVFLIKFSNGMGSYLVWRTLSSDPALARCKCLHHSRELTSAVMYLQHLFLLLHGHSQMPIKSSLIQNGVPRKRKRREIVTSLKWQSTLEYFTLIRLFVYVEDLRFRWKNSVYCDSLGCLLLDNQFEQIFPSDVGSVFQWAI